MAIDIDNSETETPLEAMDTTEEEIQISEHDETVVEVESMPSAAEIIREIPEGNYKVVTLALDLTGKKDDDEICQIGAYVHSKNSFAQYVMPFRDVSLGSVRTHGVKIFVAFGRKWRILRNVRTMKILKTKSIYSTLNDFLVWLKEVKGTTDGVILTYHEHRAINIPTFLTKAIQEYKLTESYNSLVKGVINCAKLFSEPTKQDEGEEVKDKNKDRCVSLRAFLRQAPDVDVDKLTVQLQSARNRAELTYQLHAKLLKSDGEISYKDLKAVAIQN